MILSESEFVETQPETKFFKYFSTATLKVLAIIDQLFDHHLEDYLKPDGFYLLQLLE